MRRYAKWRPWSEQAVGDAFITGSVGVNPVIYAETSLAFADANTLDRHLNDLLIVRLPLPYGAAFRAGRAGGGRGGPFRYRRAGGARSSPLPEFYIGAHAEADDPNRWRDVLPPYITNLKATPLMVGGRLFINMPTSQAASIDAETGETLWVYNPKTYEEGTTTMTPRWNQRGVVYWSDAGPRGRADPVGDRQRLPDLRRRQDRPPVRGLGRRRAGGPDRGLPARRAQERDWLNALLYSVQSPPLVVGDTVVTPSSISSYNITREAPPGWMRDFDVRTGRMKWMFHTIPQGDEFGNDTSEGDSWCVTGKVGVWSFMSADPELGLLYLPTNPRRQVTIWRAPAARQPLRRERRRPEHRDGGARVALPGGPPRPLRLELPGRAEPARRRRRSSPPGTRHAGAGRRSPGATGRRTTRRPPGRSVSEEEAAGSVRVGGRVSMNGSPRANGLVAEPAEPRLEPMFDTTEQILDQLRAGEDGRAEFKEVRLGDRGVLSPDTEGLAGELVAFANAAGGGVFLGVADSGAVAGFRRRASTRSSWRPCLQPQQLPDTITLGEMPYRHAHAQPDPGKLSVQNLEQAWAKAARAARAVN